ncbi:hypothetical protein scyTo_0006027 [Scyliorhinus torazame]|uniref:Uncharacterized protein n=1 Tax=Scyliorhinus torazame TaxID=75743 RepID=A0A401PEX4_SCYTO|nr:hypothetical protein [Scyliorhinus torazame]
MGGDQIRLNGSPNQKTKVELDRPSFEETTKQHYTASSHMEPARKEKARQINKTDIEKEMKPEGYTWQQLESLVQAGLGGENLSVAYAPSRNEKDKMNKIAYLVYMMMLLRAYFKCLFYICLIKLEQGN